MASNIIRRRATAQPGPVAEFVAPSHPPARPKRPRRVILVLALITAVILTPRAYTLLHLRSGLVRPRVDITDERQVLIVGTMGSGTNQMSAELAKLGLEVGHETSHSLETYSRDGTVSWLHGMRFLTHASGANVTLLCAESHKGAFHPFLFGPPQLRCSSFLTWSKCWAFECVRLGMAEHGCDPRTGVARARCATPFRVALLQVRHPLRTVASLFSQAGEDCRNGRHQLMTVGAILPGVVPWEELEPLIEGGPLQGSGAQGYQAASDDKNVATAASEQEDAEGLGAAFDKVGSPAYNTSRLGDQEQRRRLCISAFARYWVAYNKAMLPYVSAWYRVEDTTPCQVAKLAGFLPWPESAVYPPAAETAAAICTKREEAAYQGAGRGEWHGYRNRKNLVGLKVTWEDIGVVSKELQQEIMSLAQTFGYNTIEAGGI